jgi:hypothetical protein
LLAKPNVFKGLEQLLRIGNKKEKLFFCQIFSIQIEKGRWVKKLTIEYKN